MRCCFVYKHFFVLFMRFFLASELYSTPDLLHIFSSYLVFGCIYLPPISFLFNGPPLVRLMPFIFSFFFSHAHTRSYPLTCPPRVPYGCTTHTLFLPCNNEKETNTDKKDPEPKKRPPVIIWYAALLSETVFWAACAFFVVSQTSKSLHRRSRHPNPCLSMLLPMRS